LLFYNHFSLQNFFPPAKKQMIVKESVKTTNFVNYFFL